MRIPAAPKHGRGGASRPGRIENAELLRLAKLTPAIHAVLNSRTFRYTEQSMRLAFTLTAALLVTTGMGSGQTVTESKSIGGKTVAITYSAPKVNGRVGKLFGKDGRIGQDPTYPVWRAGANAATKFHTDADLDVGGLSVPKGDYTLYVDLADPAKWQLVISKQTGQWGLTYKKDQDLGRVPMRMAKPGALVEDLKYTLEEGGNKGNLTLAWETVAASVPITVK
jgi:hypothetical protein